MRQPCFPSDRFQDVSLLMALPRRATNYCFGLARHHDFLHTSTFTDFVTRTPKLHAMAQIRAASGEIIPVPQFSEIELGIIAAIARGKGLTVTSLADAIKAHENLHNLTEPTISAQGFPSSSYGCAAISQSHDSYQQPFSNSLLSHAMPSRPQQASEQSLGPWLPAGSMDGPNQQPGPSQAYNKNYTDYLHRGVPVDPDSLHPSIRYQTGVAQPSMFSLVEPQVRSCLSTTKLLTA
jgi:hypothetical protein